MSYKLLLAVLFSTQAFAVEKQGFVDRYHQRLSKGTLRMSENIDNYFSESIKKKKKNKSRLTLTFSTLFREAAGPVLTPELDYRLHLPNTEKKLNLIISRDDDDKDEGKGTDRAEAQTNAANEVASQTSAAIGYIFNKAGIEYSVTTGILLGIPTKLFSALTLKKKHELNKNWNLKMQEVVKWVNTDGFYSDTNFNFERPISKKYKFLFINNMFWNDENYLVTFKHGPSFYHYLAEHSTLAYHAHLSTVSNPSWFVTNYILQVKYTTLIYKNWLYMSLSPFVNFPVENNFHRSPGFLLNFDFVFGHLK